MELLTVEYIESKIEKIEYQKMGKKTMVAFATMKNGFEFIVTASCQYPKDFNNDIGKEICKNRLIDKIREFEGYLIQENIK